MIESKEEGKDQESIQSSTTPDTGHRMEMTKHKENITYKRAKRSALTQQVTKRLQETDKTVWLRQPENTKNTMDPQTKHRLGTVSNKINGGLKHVSRYQPHP